MHRIEWLSRIVCWGIRGLSLLAGVLPLRISYAISALVATGMYAFWHRGRESAVDNLHHVLGPAASETELRRTVRRAMRNFFRVLVDFLRLPRVSKEDILCKVRQDMQGEEHLERLITLHAAGQGLLIVSLHFGSWDTAALSVIDRGGTPFCIIVDDYGMPVLDAEFQAYRARHGIHIIPVGMAVRRAYRLLKEGGVVANAFDVPVSLDQGGIPVQFFDGTVLAPRGPALLALRTGAAVVTGVCTRQMDGSFKVWFKPPIEFQPTGDDEHDIRTLTQAIATECEDFIRQYPDQWYIFRRMWQDVSG